MVAITLWSTQEILVALSLCLCRTHPNDHAFLCTCILVLLLQQRVIIIWVVLFFGVVASHETKKGSSIVIIVLYFHYCYYNNNSTFVSFPCILALPYPWCRMHNILLSCSFFECFSHILYSLVWAFFIYFFLSLFSCFFEARTLNAVWMSLLLKLNENLSGTGGR
jgi:hypothetical protein